LQYQDSFKEATLDLAGNKAYYTYDASKNLTGLQDLPGLKQTNYEYNKTGLLTKVWQPVF